MRVVEVVVLVPAKSLATAKTRLRPGFGASTNGLALAMMLDVVTAAAAAPGVAEVAVVTDDRLVAEVAATAGARIVADPRPRGLNPALRDAAHEVRSRRPASALLVQPGDCPAALAQDFGAVIEHVARSRDRVFLADKDCSGTTTLAAGPGLALDPRYGPDSRLAHLRSGAAELSGSGWQRLRLDVDTPDDLAFAATLGLGRHTADWLSQSGTTGPNG